VFWHKLLTVEGWSFVEVFKHRLPVWDPAGFYQYLSA
jgi:hypothetical protein